MSAGGEIGIILRANVISKTVVVLGPETRPALALEAAVIVVSDERFPVTWSGQAAVVAAPAEIDMTNADGLRDALLEVLNAGAVGLVVDMTTTTFCDSAGIAALTRAVRRAAASDAVLRLAVTAQPVLRVLNLVGIDRLIDIYPSVSAARESLPDQADGLIR